MILQVEFAPNFVDEQELAVVKQAYGYSVSLVCAVEAFPPADITWSHQNILVSRTWTISQYTLLMPLQKSDNEENLSIYRGPAAGGFSSSTLRVSRLRPEDLGAYTCTANNKLGRANHVITVCRYS